MLQERKTALEAAQRYRVSLFIDSFFTANFGLLAFSLEIFFEFNYLRFVFFVYINICVTYSTTPVTYLLIMA